MLQRLTVPLILVVFSCALLFVVAQPVCAQSYLPEEAVALSYTIRGTVRDWDGAALTGMTVLTSWADVAQASALTDAVGAYTLTVPMGRYTISPRIPGVINEPKQSVVVPPAASGIDFTAPQRYAIRGVVRDFDNSPMSDVRVEALVGVQGGWIAAGYTDVTGAYTLTLGAGVYIIRVAKQGLPSPVDQNVTISSGVTGLDFMFPERYTISGVVRDWDGVSLAGIEVYAIDGDFYYARTISAGSGVYTLTVKTGIHLLTTYNDRHWPNPEPISVTVPPAVAGIDITFPQRYAITGMTRQSDGSPASGVWVTTSYTDPFSASYVTDVTGLYTLTVKAGVYHVMAALGNLKTGERVVSVPPIAAGVDFVLPQYHWIRGTVCDWDGKLMQGVSIQAGSDTFWASIYTDSVGRYELRVLPGVYRLHALAYGRPAPTAQTITAPSDVDIVDFVFPRAYTIRGTVRDHEGFPVRNAAVSGGGSALDGGAAQTTNDGTYMLTVVAGRWLVQAMKDGVSAQEIRRVAMPPDATGVDFTLPPPPESYTIRGTVRDQYGNPVAGATLLKAATTAADGTYTLTLPAGTHRIDASKMGYAERGSVLVRIPPAATAVDFVLYVPDRAILGRVTDLFGQPVTGAMVSAENAVCPALGGHYAETGSDGAYRLAVPAGTYRLTAYQSGFTTMPDRVVDLEGSHAPMSAQEDLTLWPAPYTISGQVRDRMGKAVVAAAVYATACGPGYKALSDASGAYTISVSAGTYALQARATSLPPAPPVEPAMPISRMLPNASAVVSTSGIRLGRISVPPSATGADIVIAQEMVTRYSVRGRVTDGEGWPIVNAYVSTAWTGSENDRSVDQTDANGEFTLRLQAGTYRVGVLKYGYARPEPRSVTVSESQTGVDFALLTAPDNVAYMVTGIIRDPRGRPASRAFICAKSLAADGWGSDTCKEAYYDGVFELALESGVYRLYAWEGRGCAAPSEAQEITVPPDHNGLNLIIRMYERLVYGVVVDSLKRPICNAQVGVREDLTYLSRTTDRWGHYFLPLPAGAYTLTAWKDGYGWGADVPIVIPMHPLSVEFVLPLPRYSLQGVVRDSRGAAVAGATVEVNGPVVMEPIATDADGVYRLYVPNGAWQVTANRPGYTAFPSVKPASVPPSPAQVDFALVPDSEVRWRYLPMVLRGTAR